MSRLLSNNSFCPWSWSAGDCVCSLDYPNQATGCPCASTGQEGAGCPTPRLALGASCCSTVTDWIAGGGLNGDMSVRLGVCLKGCFCCSVTQSCPILCDPMDCSTPGLPVPHHLLEFAQHHVHCIGDAVQPSHPLTPSSPSAIIFPSIKDFSNESSVLIRQPEYWSFSFSNSPSNVYSGLISLKIDWFDLLLVQVTFRILLQHHSSEAAILWHCAFFMVQLSQLYVTTGKTIPLTIRTFVGRVMCLLLNTLSRFWHHFPAKISDCLLISWLQSPSGVILEPKKRKSVTTFTFPPFICHEVMGPAAMIIDFWLLFFIFSFKQALSLSSTLIKRLFSCSLIFAIREW